MATLLGAYLILYLLGYFLPTIIALLVGSNRIGGVFLMNLFLGWTFIGWVWAFVWAVSPKREQQPIIINNHISSDKTPNLLITSPNTDMLQQVSNAHSLPAQQRQLENSIIKSHEYKISQLKQLKQLLDNGVLTQDEFDQQKSQILSL